jgi:hypothetical protein
VSGLSGGSVLHGPIPRIEESYGLCAIKYRNKPLHLQRVGRRGQNREGRKKEKLNSEVRCTGIVSIIGDVSTDTSTILTWISLVNRPLSRPRLTQNDNIMWDIMELIL